MEVVSGLKEQILFKIRNFDEMLQILEVEDKYFSSQDIEDTIKRLKRRPPHSIANFIRERFQRIVRNSLLKVILAADIAATVFESFNYSHQPYREFLISVIETKGEKYIDSALIEKLSALNKRDVWDNLIIVFKKFSELYISVLKPENIKVIEYMISFCVR